jgi:hypothetical protein
MKRSRKSARALLLRTRPSSLLLFLLQRLDPDLQSTDLDRRRIDDPLLPPQTLSDRVLGNDGLSRRRVGGNKDGLPSLDRGDGDFLERVELKGVSTGGRVGRDVLGDGDVRVGRGDGDSMTDLTRTRGG